LRPAAELPEIEAVAFEGYCAGMADGGWQGGRRIVRLGMCLMAAKWTWLITVMLKRANREQHVVYGDQKVSHEHLYAERANVFRMLVSWATEARTLAAELREAIGE
jgi:hypothetical protein